MSKITRKRWTDVEDSLLLELHAEGATHAQMAKTLRRTQPAINARLCKLHREPIDLGTFNPPEPKQRVSKNVIASITILVALSIVVSSMLAVAIWG